jgi:ComF family protein
MKLLDTAIGLLAPIVCRGCGAEGLVLCADCASKLMPVPSRCYRCHKATRQYRTCHACRAQTVIRRMVPLSDYEGELKLALHALKYERMQVAAAELVNLIPCPASFGQSVLFVPAPTTPQRVRVRGYDQAVLLSQAFAKKAGANHSNLLRRVSKKHQVGASGKLRREQLQGAFEVRTFGATLPSHVVLVDDVLTTGSTLEEAAKTLRAAGVKTIDAVVVAQA